MSCFLLFALPFLVLAFYFGRLYWRQRTLVQRLQTVGESASATVIDRGNQLAGRSGTVFHITYQFKPVANPKSILLEKQQTQVSGKTYKRLKQGDEVPIRYLADDPDQSILDGDYRYRANEITNLGIAVVFLVFALLIGLSALHP